ncbi:unnamed protein product [Arctogadus glacialis]
MAGKSERQEAVSSWACSVAPPWIGLFDENGCDQVAWGSSQSSLFDRLERVGAVLFKQDCVVRAIDRVKLIAGIAALQAFGLGQRPCSILSPQSGLRPLWLLGCGR